MVNPAGPVSGQGGTIGTQELPGGLSDRGIGFQAAGFAVVWLASTTILELFEGSSFWLYQWFERATVDTYWSSLVPLAVLFDWVRKMFERGKAIREAKKAEILEKMRQQLREQVQEEVREQVHQEVREQVHQEVREQVHQEVREQVHQEVRQETAEQFMASLERHGITVPPDVAEELLGKPHRNGS